MFEEIMDELKDMRKTMKSDISSLQQQINQLAMNQMQSQLQHTHEKKSTRVL